MSDDRVRNEILEMLDALECDTSAVRVEVADGQVKLCGEVRTWFDRDEIERAVWATPGVRGVDDRIIYTEGGATAEAELLP